MTNKNPVVMVLIISIIGGLIAGVVCSAVILFTVSEMAADFSDQIQNTLLTCTEEVSPFGSIIVLGDMTYYCVIEKRKGLDKEYTISQAPGVTV